MKELSFSYLGVKDIDSAESMIRLGAHALKVISNHYVVTSHIGIVDKHDCPIHEIPYQDIVSSKNPHVKKTYQRYLDYYGEEVCDLVFPKDENFIREKIYHTILFVMDRVYNCDLLRVTFQKQDEVSSITHIIYDAIQEYFDVVTLEFSKTDYKITIIKRESEIS